MKLRRFELVDPNAGVKGSNKYWEVETRENIYIVHHGARGTQGSYLPKTCPSATHAQLRAMKKIAEKVREGYHEVTPEEPWLDVPGLGTPVDTKQPPESAPPQKLERRKCRAAPSSSCTYPGCEYRATGPKASEKVKQHMTDAHGVDEMAIARVLTGGRRVIIRPNEEE